MNILKRNLKTFQTCHFRDKAFVRDKARRMLYL